jgi:hypothetical protein
MSYPGEYTQNLPRVQDVRRPVISGYVACRLRVEDPVFQSGSTTFPAVVSLTNTHQSNNLGVTFKETSDRSVSGLRYVVSGGDAVTLVPGGFREVSIAPRLPFLEVWGTAGPADMRMSISSKTRWEILGFDKDADSTYVYPPLWNVKPVPTAVSSP